MILVKFYTEDERRKIENDGKYSPLGFGDLFQFGKKPEELEVLDWQSVFSSAYSGSGTPPFRDSVSVDFLEQLGITFVDMDWYSVMYKGVLGKEQVIISVNKCPDGTYHLTGALAHFEPEIGNAISSMFNKNGGDYIERVSLVFRQDNSKLDYISSVRGIVDRTVFGFKVMENCIEIFDTYEAVQVFGAALKEAQESGKCTGYTWIRRIM